MTGKGDEAWQAGVREAVYWLSLVAGLMLLVVAINGDYLGECSADTGYEPELGFMGVVPGVLGFLGLIEAVVAVASGWPRRVAVRLGLVGAGVMALAFASFVISYMNAYEHACD